MSFSTKWESDSVLNEISRIVKSQSQNLRNIGQSTDVESDNRGGWRLRAHSNGGFFHDTHVRVEIKKHPTQGSIVNVLPESDTSPAEAQEVEDSLKKMYYSS